MKKTILLSVFTLACLIQPLNAKNEAFCSSQIVARPIPNGYSWTLASRLGEFLSLAEKEYGPRDKEWTLLGVEFTDDEQPKVWYPFNMDKKNIIIQITQEAANDTKQMALQMAHEVFHVLSPSGTRKTNVLEEGLATYFSIKAMREINIEVTPSYIASAKYRRAYSLVEKLYEQQPDASQRIREFRQSGENFVDMSLEQMKTFFPAVDDTLARQLVARF